jgi:hypothetical protein
MLNKIFMFFSEKNTLRFLKQIVFSNVSMIFSFIIPEIIYPWVAFVKDSSEIFSAGI